MIQASNAVFEEIKARRPACDVCMHFYVDYFNFFCIDQSSKW